MNKNVIIYLSLFLYTCSLFSNQCIDSSKKYYNSSNFKATINSLNKCLPDLLETKDNNLVSQVYYGLGISYYQIGKLDSSLKNLLLAENFNRKTKDKKFEAMIYNELALNSISMGLNQNAIYYLEKSLRLNSAIKNSSGKINNYINLGVSYYNIDNFEKSEAAYKNALGLLDNQNNEFYPQIINNLSVIESSRGNIRKSILLLEEVINLKSKYIQQLDILLYKTNLDMSLILLNENPQYFDEIQKYLKSTENYNDLLFADANFKAGMYMIYFGEFQKASSYLSIANSIYIENNDVNRAKQITKDFLFISKKYNSPLYKKIGIIETNLEKRQFIQYSNSLEEAFEIRSEVEDKVLNLNNELLKSKFSNDLLFLIIISIILFFPLIMKFIANRRILNEIKLNLHYYHQEITKTHDNKIKNEIAKLTSIMVLTKKYENDAVFIETVENIIGGSNELSDQINNHKLIRGQYVNTTTANELSMDR